MWIAEIGSLAARTIHIEQETNFRAVSRRTPRRRMSARGRDR